MRLFLAIDLSKDALGAIALVDEKLRRRIDSGVRWTDPNNLHLTLQFFGEVSPESVPALGAALRRAAGRVPSFSLGLTTLGAFPNVERPRIIWVGAEGEKLNMLAEAVRVETGAAGFISEDREFKGHITLGRVKERLAVELREVLAEIRVQKVESPVDKIILYQSRPGEGGSIYSAIDEFSLAP